MKLYLTCFLESKNSGDVYELRGDAGRKN